MQKSTNKPPQPNRAISSKTGAAKKSGDDAQDNAAERVRAGTPPDALPVIERRDDEETPDNPV